MEFPTSVILTSYNYYEWKLMILLHIRSKGLYQKFMGIEMEPMSEDEKFDWLNRFDMAYGRLCLSVLHDILYQIIDIELPHEIWTTLKGLYGDENDREEHHLEIGSSIYYNSHETSEDLFNNENKYESKSMEHEIFVTCKLYFKFCTSKDLILLTLN